MLAATNELEKRKQELGKACTLRRAELPEGPWLTEPTRIEWQQANGLPCLMQRNPDMYTWCGYVGVALDHPAYGHTYVSDQLRHVDVHGGLTYAGKDGNFLCDDRGYWWFGFDCSHYGDRSPGMEATALSMEAKGTPMPAMLKSFGPGATYRDEEYVCEQVDRLADQLRKMR